MLLCAHTSDLATRAFATRRNVTDRTWIKQFFRALAEFLVEHYDSVFPARAAAAYAEANRAHGRAVSGVTLMSSAAGRAAARNSLAPLIEGATMPPVTVATLCAHINAAVRDGAGSSPPRHVGLAEVERFLALVRQTPRLRAWLAADEEPPEPANLDACIDLDDMPALLTAAALPAL